mmetsp:Transcript_86254/g.175213  ORF Transcript_86254/g.175213 Transcript_86254/m.175213 type:complete len:88 (+) Transcript_86254:3705-3968(+)
MILPHERAGARHQFATIDDFRRSETTNKRHTSSFNNYTFKLEKKEFKQSHRLVHFEFARHRLCHEKIGPVTTSDALVGLTVGFMREF